MTIEIDNWETLKEQFGLVDTGDGLKTAPQLQRELKQYALSGTLPDYINVSYTSKSDAVCTFRLLSKGLDKDGNDTATYEYLGTAN